MPGTRPTLPRDTKLTPSTHGGTLGTPATIGHRGHPRIATRVDLLVIGSGIAGLFTAARAVAHGASVAVVTKAGLQQTNTRWAQGGIAAAIAPTDSADAHACDTLDAGAGLCDPETVAVLCREGPARVRDLISYGVRFDREHGADGAPGEFALALEGAHSAPRVLHARGDATGAEIEASLASHIRRTATHLHERHLLLDLVATGRQDDGTIRCHGARILDLGTDVVRTIEAAHTVLATGGGGYLFSQTTNPPVATADGVAAAVRAGAVACDLEFFQFHPTALAVAGAPRFLITEATRGDGAWLRNGSGDRFMTRYDTRADLAPRDIVARSILTEVGEGRAPGHVWLDLTHLDPERVRTHFPTINRVCARYRIDITRDLIPVAPAAHYMIGGVWTDADGRTTVPGLYAVGECASTGVHGANRLASNSLLEAVVFGERVVASAFGHTCQETVVTSGAHLATSDAGPGLQVETIDGLFAVDSSEKAVPPRLAPGETVLWATRRQLWEHAGIVRTPDGLAGAMGAIGTWGRVYRPAPVTRRAVETVNALTVGWLMTRAALARQESRGAHFRADAPAVDPAWRRRLGVRLATPVTLA